MSRAQLIDTLVTAGFCREAIRDLSFDSLLTTCAAHGLLDNTMEDADYGKLA
jgi:hypothetical protein